MRARRETRRFANSAGTGVSPSWASFQDSGVFTRGEPPNKNTTRQRTKRALGEVLDENSIKKDFAFTFPGGLMSQLSIFWSGRLRLTKNRDFNPYSIANCDRMCHTISEFFPDKDRNDETSLEHYHQLSSRLRSRSPDSPRERLRQRVHH